MFGGRECAINLCCPLNTYLCHKKKTSANGISWVFLTGICPSPTNGFMSLGKITDLCVEIVEFRENILLSVRGKM